MSVKFKTGELVTSQFDAIDSCVYSTIPVIKTVSTGLHFLPGRVERALAKDEEVIFRACPASGGTTCGIVCFWRRKDEICRAGDRN